MTSSIAFHHPWRLAPLPTLSAIVLAAALSLAFVLPMLAEGPRALTAGSLPDDVRLRPLKDLDGYFPFVPPTTTEEWAKRSAYVRRHMAVALGLWPMPTRTSLNPVIHSPTDMGDYTVEKVYLESAPGFYLTGSLYRPKDKPGKHPGFLYAHGHWDGGRFYDAGVQNVRKQIVEGAERFEDGGRNPLQSACVGLVRMGIVVFQYDMIGYADSVQISEELAHGFAKQRPEMNTTEDWGLFSPQADAHYQSVMGLQTWNSIRALDFLLDLPDVDTSRVGVTGGSGGGTQTLMLCALDDRPTLAFPAVMTSTAMQGGCTCENTCDLRIRTGNVEFAGLFAPKPLGMTCANDWTVEMSTKGFPELKQLFTLLGAPDNVMLKRGEQFEHNFNYVSRAALYRWVNHHFKLGLADPVVEPDYHRLTAEQLTVWDKDHPKPPGGPDFERKLLSEWNQDSEEHLAGARSSLDSFRQTYGGGIDIVIGRGLADVGAVEWDLKQKEDRGDHLEMTGLLRNHLGEELPAVFLYPKQWNGQTVVWVDAAGKAGLFESGAAGSAPRAHIRKLLAQGATVLGVDLLFQGEFLADGQPVKQTRKVKNPREAGAYTFGYNDTLFAQRVHDILTVVSFVKNSDRKSKQVDLVGLGEAGPWVAAARAQAGAAVDHAAVSTGGFRFGKVLAIHDVAFLPGGAKYGDLPGMLALGAPSPLWIAGEGNEGPELTREIYQLAGAAKNLVCYQGAAGGEGDAVVKWLLPPQ